MFTIENLISETPAAIADKAKLLQESGKVRLVNCTESQVRGFVRGERLYSVCLPLRQGEIDLEAASCTCLAASYQPFCKHCVALAMQAVKDPKIAALPVVTDHQKIASYLETFSKEMLIHSLNTLIQADEMLFKNWQLKADAALLTHDVKSLKKLVTKALPLRHVWQSDQVSRYFTNAVQIFEVIIEQALQLEGDGFFTLIEHSYSRLHKVNERVRDTGGYSIVLESRLRQAIQQAYSQLPWSDKKKGQWLQKLLLRDDFAELTYKDFELTDTVQQHFLASCRQVFDEIEVPQELAKRERNRQLQYVAEPLLAAAQVERNLFDEVKIYAKLATRVSDLLIISQHCLAFDDELMAEDWLIKAEAVAANSYEETLCLEQRIEVLVALGESAKAWQMAWQLFIGKPSFSEYLHLEERRELCKQPAGDDYLQQIEQLLLANYPADPEDYSSYDADDILIFYLHLQRLEAAIDWSSNHSASHILRLQLAERSANSHSNIAPEVAIDLYFNGLSQLVEETCDSAYQDALIYLLKLKKIWTSTTEQQHFSALVNRLMQSFHQKPHFASLLQDYFPDLLNSIEAD